MDVGGSGKITDGADNVFSVWSDRRRTETRAIALTRSSELHKQRNGEVQHKSSGCTSTSRRSGFAQARSADRQHSCRTGRGAGMTKKVDMDAAAG